MRQAFRQHLRLERQRHQRQRLEAAVLVIGLEQALERQQRRQQRRHPDDARRRCAATARAPARRRTGNRITVSTKNASTVAASPPWRSASRRSRATRRRNALTPQLRVARERAAKSRERRAIAGVGERERRVGRQRDPPAGLAVRGDRASEIARPHRRRGRSSGSSSSQSGGRARDEPRQRQRAAAGRRDRKRHGVSARRRQAELRRARPSTAAPPRMPAQKTSDLGDASAPASARRHGR